MGEKKSKGLELIAKLTEDLALATERLTEATRKSEALNEKLRRTITGQRPLNIRGSW